MSETSEMTVNSETVATYTVTGMTCGHCVVAVKGQVSALDGVRAVEVELAAGRVTVTSAAPLDREALAAAVDEAGYQLAS